MDQNTHSISPRAVETTEDKIQAAQGAGEGAVAAKNVTVQKSFFESEKEKLRNEFNDYGQQINAFRQPIIEKTPRFVLNNMPTIIAAVHVVADLCMLKSAGMVFMKNNRGGDKPNVFIDPLNNLFRGLTGKDKLKPGEVKLKPPPIEFMKNNRGGDKPNVFIDPVNNLFRRVSGLDASNDGKAQQNQWGLLATAVGFTGWIVGLLKPNKLESDKDIVEDVDKATQSKPRFLLQKMGDAVNVFNPNTKRENMGLFITIAGALSALSGFNNINGEGKYYTNTPRVIGGLISSVAGASMITSITDKDAWSRYGSLIWLRLPVIGLGINKMRNKAKEFSHASTPEAVAKYKKADAEWKYYAGGAAGFQGAAVASFLVGGSEKSEDGTIVDHNAAKRQARADAKERKAHDLGNHKSDAVSEEGNEQLSKPDTLVGKGSNLDLQGTLMQPPEKMQITA